MRISRIGVRRYRCLEDVEVELDDYTVLVGPNGAGKSSVLYGLDWFFNSVYPTEADLHRPERVSVRTTTDEERSTDVEVTFTDLDQEDRRVLGLFGREETAVLRRSWSPDGRRDVGRAMVEPRMEKLRATASGPGNTSRATREKYEELRETYTDLPAGLTAKTDILSGLQGWEANPANRRFLISQDEVSATDLFDGRDGGGLGARMRLVLVPASSDMTEQTGPSRSSVLAQLVGDVQRSSEADARREWEFTHPDALRELQALMGHHLSRSTEAHSDRVNELLRDLVPEAAVHIEAEPPPLDIKGTSALSTRVSINGTTTDFSRQGHGIQRAVLIAMLQALLIDPRQPEPARAVEGGPGRPDRPVGRPALVICIEEPEIYQHPVRARNFARVLADLATKDGTQVVAATHSPYFIRPVQFASLRRLVLRDGTTRVTRTDLRTVARVSGLATQRVEKFVAREVPHTFSEAFFADAVVLVEGDTDLAVIDEVARRLGRPLDARGVMVLNANGKPGLHVPYAVLTSLGIPVYLVADGDFRADPAKRESGHQSTKNLLQWMADRRPVVPAEEGAYSFGDPTNVGSTRCIFQDDLEAELGAWDDFQQCVRTHPGSPGEKTKNALVYRAAAADASLATLPQSIRDLVDAVWHFAEPTRRADLTDSLASIDLVEEGA